MESHQEFGSPPVPARNDPASQPSCPQSPTSDGPVTAEVAQSHRVGLISVIQEAEQRKAPDGYQVVRPEVSQDWFEACSERLHATELSGHTLRAMHPNSESSTAIQSSLPGAKPDLESLSPTALTRLHITAPGPTNPSVAGQGDQPSQPSTSGTGEIDGSANPSLARQEPPLSLHPLWNYPSFRRLGRLNQAISAAIHDGRRDREPKKRALWNYPSLVRLQKASKELCVTLLSGGQQLHPPQHPLWNHYDLKHLSEAVRAMAIAESDSLPPLRPPRELGLSNVQKEQENNRRIRGERICEHWPVRHYDRPDKMIGQEAVWDAEQELLNRSRHESVRMSNRMLVQTRQARAAAELNTLALDEEIVFRIRNTPQDWALVGYTSNRDAGSRSWSFRCTSRLMWYEKKKEFETVEPIAVLTTKRPREARIYNDDLDVSYSTTDGSVGPLSLWRRSWDDQAILID